MTPLIKNKTRIRFTSTIGIGMIEGVFRFEDEDGVFIRTDGCPDDWEGADFGIHPYGFVDLGGYYIMTVLN